MGMYISNARVAEAMFRLDEAVGAGHLDARVVKTIKDFLYWYGPPFKTDSDPQSLREALDRAWASWWEFSSGASSERAGGKQLELPGVLQELDE